MGIVHDVRGGRSANNVGKTLYKDYAHMFDMTMMDR
jgi:hypothetical protein